MQGRDCGLQCVRPETPGGQRLLDERDALLYLIPVPLRAVLFLERDQLTAGVRARGAARVVQHHQREQPRRLCVR